MADIAMNKFQYTLPPSIKHMSSNKKNQGLKKEVKTVNNIIQSADLKLRAEIIDIWYFKGKWKAEHKYRLELEVVLNITENLFRLHVSRCT